MSSSRITIHEFSTGITPERTATGGWVSRGFTGRYMNSTLGEIPYAIERSIANKEFAVAEGASSDRATVIGRVIDDWSVIAFITKGRDEKGRSASFYRYFLTQSPDGLTALLSWIEESQHQGTNFTFDPYEQRGIGDESVITPILSRPEHIQAQDYISQTPYILDPRQSYSFKQLNQLAATKSCENGQPISWAFNVEALEQAGRFQVIYPASELAIKRIKQSLTSVVVPTNSAIDEQAIRSAIKSLMNSSQVKADAIEILGQSIGSTEKILGDAGAQTFWNDIFDGQGAGNALRQKIFSPQMGRLMTIRAMILPETAAEFLDWLQISDSKQPTAQANASLNLQSQISKSSTSQFEDFLLIGIDQILEGVFYEELSSEAAYWLLGSKGSVWHSAMRPFLSSVHTDFKTLGNRVSQSVPYQLESKYWKEIRSKISSSFNSFPSKPDEKYIVLANLISSLGDHSVAACLYQAGTGEVPDSIYKAAKNTPGFQSSNAPDWGKAFDIPVRKEVTASDNLQNFASSQFFQYVFLPISTMLLLIGITFLGLNFFGSIGNTTKNNPKENISKSKENYKEEQVLQQDTEIFKSNRISQEVIETIDKNKGDTDKFKSTKSAIQFIVNSLKKDKDIVNKNLNTDDQILSAIKQEMVNSLQISEINPPFKQDEERNLIYEGVFIPSRSIDLTEYQIQGIKRNWSVAIYFYQKSKQKPPLGYMDTTTGLTANILLTEVKTRLLNQQGLDMKNLNMDPPPSAQSEIPIPISPSPMILPPETPVPPNPERRKG